MCLAGGWYDPSPTEHPFHASKALHPKKPVRCTVPTFLMVGSGNLQTLMAPVVPLPHSDHYHPPPCHRYHQISLADATVITDTFSTIASPFGAIALCSSHHTFQQPPLRPPRPRRQPPNILVLFAFSCSESELLDGGDLHSPSLTHSLTHSQHLSRPSLVKGPRLRQRCQLEEKSGSNSEIWPNPQLCCG